MNKPNQITSLLISLLICGAVKADTSNLDVSTNILLKLSGAKSVEELMNHRTQNMHEVMQYFEYYRKCETSFAKTSFLLAEMEGFAKKPKLAKSIWNKFIDNELNNQITEKLSTLTNDNLLDKAKECKLRKRKINRKLKEEENKMMELYPNIRLDLDFKRDRKLNK